MMVVREIEDGLLEEIEMFGWSFKKDIGGESEDDSEKRLVMGCLVWAQRIKYSKIHAHEIRYDVSDLQDTMYQTSLIWRIGLIGYGVLGSSGMVYWGPWVRRIGSLGMEFCTSWVQHIELLGYRVLVKSVFLLIFDQSIIYDIYTDVDMTYSSKLGNGLEFFKVLDTSYRSRIIRRICYQINRLS
nr:hypothetical protein [Tanacetum cinerariifolium]